MEVIDLDGKKIKVTDLGEALKQAQMFKSYRHADKTYRELDKKLKQYWTDLYNKLTALKNRQ